MIRGFILFYIFSSLICQNSFGKIEKDSVLIASEFYQYRSDDALYSTHKCWFYETNENLTPKAVLFNNLPFALFDKELYATALKKYQWLQFYIYNDFDKTIHLYLGTGQNNYVHTYLFKNNILLTSCKHGFLENPKNFNNQETCDSKITLLPRDTFCVLVKINNYVPYHWNNCITLFNQENYSEYVKYWKIYFNLIESTFFFGAIFFAFCFVLGLYYYFRHQIYLTYLIYLTSIIIFGFSKIERVVNLLYIFHLPPELFYYIHEPIILFMSGAYGFFILQILDIKKDNYPKLYRYIFFSSSIILIGLVILLIWIYITHFAHHNRIMDVLIPVLQINNFIIYINLLFIRSIYKKIVLVGVTFLLITAFLTFILDDIFKIPFKIYGIEMSYYILLKFGLLIEVIFFSIALGKRTYIFEQEKNDNYKKYINQLELKNELSDKVNEFKNKALRSQINPHFLFNSLNAVNYLISSEKLDKATDYVNKFSDFFRNILDYSRIETISLEEELNTCKLYLQLEQERLNNRFKIYYDIDGEIELQNIQLPPLLLQPFLENAIWHGIHNCDDDDLFLEISVKEEEDENCVLSIYDNGIGRQTASKIKKFNNRNSHGTDITNERIHIFNQMHDEKIRLSIIDKPENKNHKGTLIQLLFEL